MYLFQLLYLIYSFWHHFLAKIFCIMNWPHRNAQSKPASLATPLCCFFFLTLHSCLIRNVDVIFLQVFLTFENLALSHWISKKHWVKCLQSCKELLRLRNADCHCLESRRSVSVINHLLEGQLVLLRIILDANNKSPIENIAGVEFCLHGNGKLYWDENSS